jgi:gas vesicle protein
MVAVAAAFSIGFAAAIVVLAASFAIASSGRLSGRAAYGLAALTGCGATSAWIALAFEPELSLAVAAAGLTVCALAQLGAYTLSRLIRRARSLDADFTRADERLRTLIERESTERGAELERTLVIARADSASILADEERRLADDRRRSLVAREAQLRDELAASLSAAQQQVERRFAEWSSDLDRVQERLAEQISKVGERQRELVAKVESRIAADAERIVGESEEQRAAVARMRDELGRTIEESVQAANAELESQSVERRRALHEVAERLRKREHALREQIDREETEASRRIAAGFAEIERKQLDQLQRVIDRATSGYAEIASQQFGEAIKNAREDAAKRLAREMERAVASFEREASGVLSDKLGQISDAGTQRLEKRLGQIAAGLERQRDDAVAALERRLAEAEEELMRRVQALMADVDADRTVVQARLAELGRRIDETYARAR